MRALNILVLGGGAWGTAVACAAALHPAKHRVTLWMRDDLQAKQVHQSRINQRYLPEVVIPASLEVLSGAWLDRLSNLDVLILGTPVHALRDLLKQIAKADKNSATPVVWLCKGIEQRLQSGLTTENGGFGLLPHEVQQQVASCLQCGVLSGPSFALEVARGQPTALVATSEHTAIRQLLVDAFHAGPLRIYTNTDVVGAEVGGAVKNVLAIATGICDGLELGLNARAALLTRGLAEMTRLGLALGANLETFMGLTGIGDLVLTSTGGLSRNRKVGLLLSQGKSLSDILHTLGHVAEGALCAREVVQRANLLGIEVPVSQAVVDLLNGQKKAAHVLADLLAREPSVEKTTLL